MQKKTLGVLAALALSALLMLGLTGCFYELFLPQDNGNNTVGNGNNNNNNNNPDPPPVATVDRIEGRFTLISVTVDGETMSSADLASAGIDLAENFMEFNTDGTCQMTLLGETLNGTYKIKGDTITVDDKQEPFNMTLDTMVGTITYRDGNNSMVFRTASGSVSIVQVPESGGSSSSSSSGSSGSSGGNTGNITSLSGTYYLEYVEDSSGHVIASGSTLNGYYPRNTNYYRFIDEDTLMYGFDDGSGGIETECSYRISNNRLIFTNLSTGNSRTDTLRDGEILEPGNDGSYVYVLDK